MSNSGTVEVAELVFDFAEKMAQFIVLAAPDSAKLNATEFRARMAAENKLIRAVVEKVSSESVDMKIRDVMTLMVVAIMDHCRPRLEAHKPVAEVANV